MSFLEAPAEKETWESGQPLEELPKIREVILTEAEKEDPVSEWLLRKHLREDRQ